MSSNQQQSTVTRPQVAIGGLTLSVNPAAQTRKTLSGVAIKKEDRHDSSMTTYDLNKLKYQVVSAEQLEDGQLLDLQAVTDQTSLEEVYDATQIIKQLQTHLKRYDMLSTFTILCGLTKDSNGEILANAPTESFDLFEQHSKVSYDQITDSILYFMRWVYCLPSAATSTNPASPNNAWVETDLTWSGEFILNQMSSKLAIAIKDDLKDKGVAAEYQETGPIVLKALINYNALKLLKSSLTRDKVSLDLFDGDVEEFTKKYALLIERLRQCETRDPSGALIGLEHVPSDLSETLLLVLSNTGHRQFDLIMEQKYANSKCAAAMGKVDPFDKPEEILSEARLLYLGYRQAGDWDPPPSQNKNPSGFTAATQSKGQCFGCGRVGCRQTERSCPRFNKTASPEGVAAKAAFDAKKKERQAKKQSDKGDKKKWPKKPGKTDPKRLKILGTWHYYHFKQKKWLKCDDQSDAVNEKAIADASAKQLAKAQLAGENVPHAGLSAGQSGLPAALAALVRGKRTLKKSVYKQLSILKDRKSSPRLSKLVSDCLLDLMPSQSVFGHSWLKSCTVQVIWCHSSILWSSLRCALFSTIFSKVLCSVGLRRVFRSNGFSGYHGYSTTGI